MKIVTVGSELFHEEGQVDGGTDGRTDRLESMTMEFVNLSATLKLQVNTLSINNLSNLLHIVTSHRKNDQFCNNLVLMILTRITYFLNYFYL
jgi:hypothetical protein